MRLGPIPIPPADLRVADLAGRRVGIWGAGREGTAALRALRNHAPGGTAIVVTSTAPPGDAPPLPFPDVPWLHGDEGLDALSGCDVVIRSAGVPVRSAEADRVRMGGATITTGTALWFAERVDRETVIGVTGTKGKSTTASLIHHLLGRAGVRSRLAGNIGRPLLDELTPDDPPEAWVVELSSYQLSDLPRAPTIAVVTNLLRDHLPWHGDEQTYHDDKLRILTAEAETDRPEAGAAAKRPDGAEAGPGSAAGTGAGNDANPAGSRRRNPRMAILSHADPGLRAAGERLAAPVLWVDDPQGLHVAEGEIRNGNRPLGRLADLPLRGVIGGRNVAAALEAVHALGYEIPDLVDALRDFVPLPHRQQVVAVDGGRTWVDDSISTTPEAALAAVAAFAPGPVVLIAGGDHRDQRYEELARALATGRVPTGAIGEPPVEVAVAGVVTLPGTGPEIAAAIAAAGAADADAAGARAGVDDAGASDAAAGARAGVDDAGASDAAADARAGVDDAGRPASTEQAIGDVRTERPPVSVRQIEGRDPDAVMRDAVAAASELAPPGATVLLSPAAPSHNVFRNFEDRGDRFAAAVLVQLGT